MWSIFLSFKDNLFSTYSEHENELIFMSFDRSLISKTPSEVIELYHLHYFDILGSGWTQVVKNKKYRGFEGNNYSLKKYNNLKSFFLNSSSINKSNRSYSNYLISKLDTSYHQIDWQVDIKSGFRWSESTHSKFIKFGDKTGVDVKLPWELSRMHHLVHLASDYSKSSSPLQKNKNKNEFKNQVIDFIANNPPRFGVNWVCSMDVAIRISNILLAFDIFISSKCIFSENFKNILANSIYDHGKHIINNLEWYNGVRGNHYFSNIIGLLFCSRHLKETETTQAWFVFGVSELINELDFQFYSDGGNFEGSTFYHRLVTELAVWGTVIALNHPKTNLIKHNKVLEEIYSKNNRIENLSKINSSFIFSKKYFLKLNKTICFLEDLKLYDGTIPQIGDNDSGRLFKLNPTFEKLTVKEVKFSFINLKKYDEFEDCDSYFLENHLKVDCLLTISNSILLSQFSNIFKERSSFKLKEDYNFLKTLFTNKKTNQKLIKNIKIFSNDQINNYLKEISLDESKRVIKKYFQVNEIHYKNQLQVISYDMFGVYIYKSKNLYILIRSKDHKKIPIVSGHFHQDQLSIELHINNKPIITDPGSYIYTPSIQKRNLYRSENAHFSPIQNNTIDLNNNNIFKLENMYSSKVLHFSNFGFYGSITNENKLYNRFVLLNHNTVKIIDIIPVEECDFEEISLPYSSGYGILKNSYNE